MFIAYSDRIGECPAAGCSGNPPVIRAADQYGPRSLTSDATAIYWVAYDGGMLMRLAK